MATANIKYRGRIPSRSHAPCRRASKCLRPDEFASYRNAFERCVVEPGIISGELGRVQSIPLSDPFDWSPFAEFMGIEGFWLKRMDLAQGFLADYERFGRRDFSMGPVFDTELYADSASRLSSFFPARRVAASLQRAFSRDIGRLASGSASIRSSALAVFFAVLSRRTPAGSSEEGSRKNQGFNAHLNRAIYAADIQPFLDMFDNMKADGGLVPSSKSSRRGQLTWRPGDFPWAIKYFDYVKKRDGSHRRAVMKYLKHDSVDTIVVDLANVTGEYVATRLPALADRYDWFRSTVEQKFKEGVSF